VLTPAGAYGPAFLALENFLVIKRYNMSDLYALFVGNLGDRIAGGAAFVTPWTDVQQLPAKSVEGIQESLQALGYNVAKIDGKAGMNTRSLIGAYQKANGLKIDCWPTEALLTHVRAKAPAKAPPVKGADAAPAGAATIGQPAARIGR
jgi:peptidoglycan hydrolase-like protein with peptidoglycan-binding domain